MGLSFFHSGIGSMLPGEDKLSFPAIGWVRSCNTLVSITFIVRLMNTLDLTLIYLPFDEYTRSYTYYDLISILYLLWSYTYYIYPFFARYPFFVVCFSFHYSCNSGRVKALQQFGGGTETGPRLSREGFFLNGGGCEHQFDFSDSLHSFLALIRQNFLKWWSHYYLFHS